MRWEKKSKRYQEDATTDVNVAAEQQDLEVDGTI